jgi:Flp pilus assembly protein TadG
MKKKMTIKNQKGAAIVEFAIVLPLLILLFIGICEFGLLWYNSQVIINASREGARAGIARAADAAKLYPDPDGIDYIVIKYCEDRLVTFGGIGLSSTTFPNGDDNMNTTTKPFGVDFSVQVTYNYNFLVPSIFHLGLTKTIFGRTLMKMEQVLGP